MLTVLVHNHVYYYFIIHNHVYYVTEVNLCGAIMRLLVCMVHKHAVHMLLSCD